MQQIEVDGLVFSFPDNWHIGKYDSFDFYRKQFQGIRKSVKALDLLAVAPDSETLWLIEVKDYRRYPRTKPTSLPDEIVQKVFDTMAALLPMKVCSDEPEERKMAECALAAKQLRVVFHLEYTAHTGSQVWKQPINPQNIARKLRKALKPIDSNPLVVSIGCSGMLKWTVC